ncbi:MAG: tetratricopeptide repeat protein [Rhizobiaceae bacterium]|nr:tetratricopeptide repeat protein [Rhizobiaceae bacterium]
MNKFPLTTTRILLISTLLAIASPASAYKELNEVVEYTGLAGSYLAARVATADNDDLAAVSFLEKSLKLDPHNNQVKQNLFHAYLASGRIEDAVLLSRDISDKNADDYIVKMVNSVELIRKRSWAKAINKLSDEKGSDLDNLITKIIIAWAKFGNGEAKEALAQIDTITGANWMDVLKDLHRGLIMSASGNDAEAVLVLQKAISNRASARLLSETYINAVDALVRAQQRLGNLDAARAAVKAGLDIFPNLPALHTMNEALDEGKPASLLISNPQQGVAELFYNLGNAISREGGTPFAQIYLQLAKHLYPESAPITISLANIFEKQEKPERANSYYEQIADDSPYKRRAQLETAINKNTVDDVEGAIAILRDLVKEKPSDLVPIMTLGRVLNQRERYREAVLVFDKAIAQIEKPQRLHWDFFYRRAVAYERLKEWDKAEIDFKKSLQLDPNRATVLNYLGYSWVDKGINLDEGLDMIKKAVKLRPQAGFIVDSLGWAYYKLKRYEEAVVELEKAVQMLPQDPVVNDHLGDAYWKVGRKLEAKFQWQHALDAEPEEEEIVKIKNKLRNGLVEAGEKPVAKSE